MTVCLTPTGQGVLVSSRTDNRTALQPTEAAAAVGTSQKNLQRWKQALAQEASGEHLPPDERTELHRLRRENQQLLMEKDILQMETALVVRALTMAVNLRNPPAGLLHHSDRGSQYANKEYQQLLRQNYMVCSMRRKGNCWDNAPTERFFGSLKREWLNGNRYVTRHAAIRDVQGYIAYYNPRRLQTTIGDKTPIEFEANPLAKCA